ncbi:MAG TPA: XRE family transcriptional regulator [Clostridiales bacterium]|nr:XRE family transcriptional regulator [Clostridiales bacterium]
MDRKALGKRLSAARKEAGYTTDRLAQECDVGAVYIRQIEAGRYQPSMNTLIKLGDTLHRSLDYFVQDSVEWNELNTLTGIAEKCRNLTPDQLKMVERMIEAMYETKSEEK